MGLIRTKAQWSIPGAGTAFTVFHFITVGEGIPDQTDADAATVKTRKFFDDLKVAIPNQVTIQALGEAEVLDEATGVLDSLISTATPAVVQGTAAAATGWSAPTGAVVSWSTSGIRNNRRVRGRTFVVPCTTGAYDTDGTLRPGERAVIDNAANLFRVPTVAILPAIYARPSGPGASDGVAHGISGYRVPDMCAILRSRRS